MLFNFTTKDSEFNSHLNKWSWEARRNYGMVLLIVLATPFAASLLQGQVTAEVVDHWLSRWSVGSWLTIYIVGLVLMFVLVELIGLLLVASAAEKYPIVIRPQLQRLTRKSGFKEMPKVVYIPDSNLLNAGATRSLLFGRKVVLFGDIGKLNEKELEAVLAHEMAHLIMRDVRVGQFVRAMLLSIRLVTLMTLLSLITAVFVGEHSLVWFLLTSYLVTLAGGKLAKLFYLRYSRVCEYRADAIAVQLTTDLHRRYLMDAIKKVREVGLLVALKKREAEEVDWDKTHPSFVKRAKALGIKKLFGSGFIAEFARLAS